MKGVKWEKSADKRKSYGKLLKKKENGQESYQYHHNTVTNSAVKENASRGANSLFTAEMQTGARTYSPGHSAGHPRKKHRRTASLTELRPEDKKKVANLIQELAMLSGEKDRVECLLKKERDNFETAITELVSDQKRLLTERQCVQSELITCQKMLNQLQDVVLNKPPSLVMTESDTKETRSASVTTSNSRTQKLQSDLDGHSALDLYLSKQSSILDSMEVASDVCSVISEPPRHPKLVTKIDSIHTGMQSYSLELMLCALD